MGELSGIANELVNNSPGNPQSRLQVLQNQAEELRVAFNRKHFIECNMSIFDVDELEEAAKRYEKAKCFLKLDVDHNGEIPETTILKRIFNALKVHLDEKRYVPFFVSSLLLGKHGVIHDSLSHLWGLYPYWG
jgi:hypothetical protein